MTIDYKIIGERVKSSRLNRNMTQAELAERTEMSDVYISRIETGVRSPSLNSLIKIAKVLGTTLDSLVHGNTTTRLPKVYHDFAYFLSDCDDNEREQILENARMFRMMLREKS